MTTLTGERMAHADSKWRISSYDSLRVLLKEARVYGDGGSHSYAATKRTELGVLG